MSLQFWSGTRLCWLLSLLGLNDFRNDHFICSSLFLDHAFENFAVGHWHPIVRMVPPIWLAFCYVLLRIHRLRRQRKAPLPIHYVRIYRVIEQLVMYVVVLYLGRARQAIDQSWWLVQHVDVLLQIDGAEWVLPVLNRWSFRLLRCLSFQQLGSNVALHESHLR